MGSPYGAGIEMPRDGVKIRPGACLACGQDVQPGQSFCIRCGSPLSGRVRRALGNPFERTKMRSLVIWAAVNALPALVLLAVAAAAFDLDTDDEGWIFAVVIVWAYAALAAWLLWQFWRRQVSFGRLLGSPPDGHDWPLTIGVLTAAILFSFGSALVISALLSYVGSGWAEGFTGAGDWLDDVPVVFLLAIVLVVAPVTEEVLFRGFMLHRLAVKWGLKPAIVVSSVAFGLLHINFVGVGVLGVVMALLYVRTRTLIVPIVCHVLNNGVAVSLVILAMLTSTSGAPQAAPASEQVREGIIVGSALLLLSTPALAYFVYKSWPRAGARPPYIAEES